MTDLFKTFDIKGGDESAVAVDGVSFEIPTGTFFTLLGPSGCGKTTTLRCVAGLERPTSGTVEVDDLVVCSDNVFVPANKRDVGMVFQSYAVWPHMTVYDNVAFPLSVVKDRMPAGRVQDRVRETLALVGLDGLENRKSTQLSGGQQQRLSLARALVHRPKCLLFDEPLSNLDAKLRERMRTELSEIQRTLGFTALYVTHDQIEALSLSDEVAVMHQGKVVQRGTPEDIYFTPANRLVAEFIGSTNLLPGRIGPVTPGSGLIPVETAVGRLWCQDHKDWGAVAEGTPVLVAFRPEDIEVTAFGAPAPGSASNIFRATLRRTLFGGALTEAVADVSGTRLRVQASSRSGLQEGAEVGLVIDPRRCRIMANDLTDAELLEEGAITAAGPA